MNFSIAVPKHSTIQPAWLQKNYKFKMAEKRACLDPILDFGENECVFLKEKWEAVISVQFVIVMSILFVEQTMKMKKGSGHPISVLTVHPTTVNNAMDKNDMM